MKTIVLYRPKSEHARAVDVLVHDYFKRTTNSLELIDVDSREGADLQRLYDATTLPAILAVRDDGQLNKMWQGTIPLIQEIEYYA